MFKADNDCYTTAFNEIAEHKSGTVIHGWICTGKVWYAHAWFELNGIVHDKIRIEDGKMSIDAYYNKYSVEEKRVLRYPHDEYFTVADKDGTYGPFDTELFFQPEFSDGDPLDEMKK